MIGDLLARRRAAPRATAATAWVYARVARAPNDVVSVAELACRDDACPDMERVVIALRAAGGPTTWRIDKPLRAVNRADLEALGARTA